MHLSSIAAAYCSHTAGMCGHKIECRPTRHSARIQQILCDFFQAFASI